MLAIAPTLPTTVTEKRASARGKADTWPLPGGSRLSKASESLPGLGPLSNSAECPAGDLIRRASSARELTKAAHGGLHYLPLICSKRQGINPWKPISNKVFAGENGTTISPYQRDVDGFKAFMEGYKMRLVIKRTAVDASR